MGNDSPNSQRGGLSAYQPHPPSILDFNGHALRKTDVSLRLHISICMRPDAGAFPVNTNHLLAEPAA